MRLTRAAFLISVGFFTLSKKALIISIAKKPIIFIAKGHYYSHGKKDILGRPTVKQVAQRNLPIGASEIASR